MKKKKAITKFGENFDYDGLVDCYGDEESGVAVFSTTELLTNQVGHACECEKSSISSKESVDFLNEYSENKMIVVALFEDADYEFQGTGALVKFKSNLDADEIIKKYREYVVSYCTAENPDDTDESILEEVEELMEDNQYLLDTFGVAGILGNWYGLIVGMRAEPTENNFCFYESE